MKVDMSPEAITARLRTVDELWLLSVKLMNAKPTDGEPLAPPRSRAIEILDAIREVLFKDWDPIGINDCATTVAEYDAYIAPVYRILVGSRSENDLVETFRKIEREQMGLGASSHEKLHSVANKLLELHVALD
jgi:hypothetical protein